MSVIKLDKYLNSFFKLKLQDADKELYNSIRDEFMRQLDKKYPIYAFAQNKGYGTAHHLNALKESGYSCFHRKTFKGVIVE